jgi:hypothetical protein
MTTADTLSIQLTRRRTQQRGLLRERVKQQLYPIAPPDSRTNPGDNSRNDALINLANTFSRYASTQATAYDNGAARTSATSLGNTLERQVERALSQVLGRAPGRGAGGFTAALNAAYPVNGTGQIAGTPSRSAVSLYSPAGGSQANSIAAGLAGQLSSGQATLYRQTSIIAADAIKVLESLQPFVPEADLDRVNALRSLVRADIQSLVEETGRIDEPRVERVDSYHAALNGANGHLRLFGQRAFLDRRLATPATTDDETQIAGFELLVNYAGILRTIWNKYKLPKNSVDFPMFSERLARSSVLLPVIAEGNANFMAAMDSIGFTENERRSSATKFSTLGTGRPRLPDMTVNDLNEWIDHFATRDGPAALADSGQYGLEFITAQADQLFWVIVPILAFIKTTGTPTLNSLPVVAQALAHERVSWALDDMFNQIDALADLSAPRDTGPRPRTTPPTSSLGGSIPK